uniref:EF-hand_14 domain-containing protein n=1 Tax=Bursaphelenchus xylophilus TaxID=6326 RepID=A0A1I7S5B1_BURXY
MVKRAGRGLSVKDLPDHLAELLRLHDVKGTPLTRAEVCSRFTKEHGCSRESTEKALDALIQMHKVIEVASEQNTFPVLHDLLRFKMSRERRLRVGPTTDLYNVVRNSLIERSARSSQYALSVSEIHDYVQLTYQLEGNSDEHLFAGLALEFENLFKFQKKIFCTVQIFSDRTVQVL